MSWEAYRWTAKTPSELFQVLGPHGVDDLIRQALGACWRESPVEGRSVASVSKFAWDVFDRNMKVWARIKKPSPAAFFEDLRPNPADQFIRQAMVTCWMMMPRAGGRDVADVRRIVGKIFERNMSAWQEDDATFRGKPEKRNAAATLKVKRTESTKKREPTSKRRGRAGKSRKSAR